MDRPALIPPPPTPFRSRKKRWKCFRCGDPGHIAAHCGLENSQRSDAGREAYKSYAEERDSPRPTLRKDENERGEPEGSERSYSECEDMTEREREGAGRDTLHHLRKMKRRMEGRWRIEIDEDEEDERRPGTRACDPISFVTEMMSSADTEAKGEILRDLERSYRELFNAVMDDVQRDLETRLSTSPDGRDPHWNDSS